MKLFLTLLLALFPLVAFGQTKALSVNPSGVVVNTNAVVQFNNNALRVGTFRVVYINNNDDTVTVFQLDNVTGATAFGGSTLTLNGNLVANKSISLPIVSKSTNYTSTASDHTVLLNADSITNTLPTAVGITGRIYVVKAIEATPIEIAVQGAGAETIDGANVFTFLLANDAIQVQSDGTNWRIIGNK